MSEKRLDHWPRDVAPPRGGGGSRDPLREAPRAASLGRGGIAHPTGVWGWLGLAARFERSGARGLWAHRRVQGPGDERPGGPRVTCLVFSDAIESLASSRSAQPSRLARAMRAAEVSPMQPSRKARSTALGRSAPTSRFITSSGADNSPRAPRTQNSGSGAGVDRPHGGDAPRATVLPLIDFPSRRSGVRSLVRWLRVRSG
jgi:hypothetical protein